MAEAVALHMDIKILDNVQHVLLEQTQQILTHLVHVIHQLTIIESVHLIVHHLLLHKIPEKVT